VEGVEVEEGEVEDEEVDVAEDTERRSGSR
jgi:hypothetical protein